MFSAIKIQQTQCYHEGGDYYFLDRLSDKLKKFIPLEQAICKENPELYGFMIWEMIRWVYIKISKQYIITIFNSLMHKVIAGKNYKLILMNHALKSEFCDII